MGMHFKLGLYEHQSAGAIQGVIDLIAAEPRLLDDPDQLLDMRIMIYEPAFSIIGDPASAIRRRGRAPTTRWCTSWPRCCARRTKRGSAGWDGQDGWRRLMLTPADYAEDESALFHPLTRRLMQQIDFRHGGPEFDRAISGRHSDDRRIRAREAGPAHQRPGDVPAGPRPLRTRADLAALLGAQVPAAGGLGVDDVDALVEPVYEPGGQVAGRNCRAVRLQNSRVGGVSDGSTAMRT